MSAAARLLVVALGGNAVSPPSGDLSLDAERETVREAAAEIARVAAGGTRLLVVHGNGPQVGRLLACPALGGAPGLDVHVAQTQGELGYLLTDALERFGAAPCVALVTRALVDPLDPAFAVPTKAVGPLLAAPPGDGPWIRAADGRGVRRAVASPRPLAILEVEAVRRLVATHHVVVGGGGGVAMIDRDGARRPAAGVIDKDRVAALLAIALDVAELVFVTDVPCAFDGFGGADPRPIRRMTIAEARARLGSGAFAAGSMAPKVESALAFAEATGRGSVITTIGEVARSLHGDSGTRIGR